MNTAKLIVEAHKNAIEKGFYECRSCDGGGVEASPDRWNKMIACPMCKGTKKYRDVKELLCLMVGELCGEAIEAHRKNKITPIVYWNGYENIPIDLTEEWPPNAFEDVIKDTFEDEIADTFIRLFDLCGYVGIENLRYYKGIIMPKKINTANCFYVFIKALPETDESPGCVSFNNSLSIFCSFLYNFCISNKIDIKNHIRLKMAYNKTRPDRHGKEY